MKHVSLQVNRFGEKFWWFHLYGTHIVSGYRHHHNKYGPAFIELDCFGWLHHGKLHRLDGPAVEYATGGSVYYINDIKYDTYLEYLVDAEAYGK